MGVDWIMKRFKKICAVVLSATMVFSMAGCGAKKEKEVKKTAKTITKATSISEATASFLDYTEGDYSMSFEIGTKDSNKVNLKIQSDGKISGEEGTVGVKVNLSAGDESISRNFDDIITVADGRMYLDLDKILNGYVGSDLKTKFGKYGLLIPEVKETEDMFNARKELAEKMAEGYLKDIDVEENDDEFTVKIDTPEEFETLLINAVNTAYDNREEMTKISQETMNIVDYDEYLKELKKDIKTDLIKATKILGVEIGENKIDKIFNQTSQFIKEAKESSDASNMEEDIEEAKKEFEDELDEIVDEKWKEEVKNYEAIYTVKATESEYECQINLNVQQNPDLYVKFDYKVSVDPSVKIEAPKSSSLADIAQYAKDNQEDLMSEISKIQDTNEKLKDIADILDQY